MIKLAKEQILLLHAQLIENTGGSNGIRDMGLLESALESPFQSFGGEELYPSIQAKDFEDCLVAACAKSIHCDYIATRKKRDFEGFGIPAFTPTEILLQIM